LISRRIWIPFIGSLFIDSKGVQATPQECYVTLASRLIQTSDNVQPVESLPSQGFGEMFGAATLSLKSAGVIASLFLLVFLLAGGYYVQVIP